MVRLDYATGTLKGGEGPMWQRGDGERAGRLREALQPGAERSQGGRGLVPHRTEGGGLSAQAEAGGTGEKNGGRRAWPMCCW